VQHRGTSDQARFDTQHVSAVVGSRGYIFIKCAIPIHRKMEKSQAALSRQVLETEVRERLSSCPYCKLGLSSPRCHPWSLSLHRAFLDNFNDSLWSYDMLTVRSASQTAPVPSSEVRTLNLYEPEQDTLHSRSISVLARKFRYRALPRQKSAAYSTVVSSTSSDPDALKSATAISLTRREAGGDNK
jgi:hypothetical protein